MEITNKVIEAILTKTVRSHRRDWADRLPEALWAYHTTWRNTTGFSPYDLVYGKSVALLHFDPKSDSAWISFFKLTKNHKDNFFFVNVATSVA